MPGISAQGRVRRRRRPRLPPGLALLRPAGCMALPAYAASTDGHRPPALAKHGPGRTRPCTRTVSPRARPASCSRQGCRSSDRRSSASAMGRLPFSATRNPTQTSTGGPPSAIDSRSSSTSGASAQNSVRRRYDVGNMAHGRYPSTRRNSQPSRTGYRGPPWLAACEASTNKRFSRTLPPCRSQSRMSAAAPFTRQNLSSRFARGHRGSPVRGTSSSPLPRRTASPRDARAGCRRLMIDVRTALPGPGGAP